MVVPGIVGAKAAKEAVKPLFGDIYVRRTAKVVGKGKKRKEVEGEVHVNIVSLAIGALALGAAATAGAIALYASGQRIGRTDGITVKRRVIITWAEGAATAESVLTGKGTSTAEDWLAKNPEPQPPAAPYTTAQMASYMVAHTIWEGMKAAAGQSSEDYPVSVPIYTNPDRVTVMNGVVPVSSDVPYSDFMANPLDYLLTGGERQYQWTWERAAQGTYNATTNKSVDVYLLKTTDKKGWTIDKRPTFAEALQNIDLSLW